MGDKTFPKALDTHDKHFPSERFAIGIRRSVSDGHNLDNFIGGIPKNTEYMRITLWKGGWNSDTWDRLEEAYENEGFNTHLRKTSGTTRTRSGTCKHAPTSMYVW
jgi:hypothetical protein